MAFVAGVGKANLDLIYSGLSRMPREGEELYAKGFSLCMGGGVAATLINLGRLNVPASLATFLGEDMFSGFVADQFSANGVKPQNLYRGDGIPLNVSAAMLTPGERTFVSFSDPVPPTDSLLEEAYQVLSGARLIPMQPEEGYLELYRKLSGEGSILVLDTGWDDELSFAKYGAFLELADYYTPNAKEAMKITGEQTPEKAADRLRTYFDRVIVKLDKEGCLLLEEGKLTKVPEIPQFGNLDSTGAGDAFLSGLLYGLFHGYPLRDAVLFGNITGGKCVTGLGCLTAYVTEPELLALADTYRSLIA